MESISSFYPCRFGGNGSADYRRRDAQQAQTGFYLGHRLHRGGTARFAVRYALGRLDYRLFGCLLYRFQCVGGEPAVYGFQNRAVRLEGYGDGCVQHDAVARIVCRWRGRRFAVPKIRLCRRVCLLQHIDAAVAGNCRFIARAQARQKPQLPCRRRVAGQSGRLTMRLVATRRRGRHRFQFRQADRLSQSVAEGFRSGCR